VKASDASETLEDVMERAGPRAKSIALMIAALAALLAVVEVSGGNAEQDAQKSNVDSANLWAFYQAKTIRQTVLRTAAEELALELPMMSAQDRAAAAQKQLDAWRATAERYESEPTPEGGEGRRELMARAKAAEETRDRALAQDDMFDYASAALQLAIVLASASIVISIGWLSWLAAGIGILGFALAVLGWFAPTMLVF
jgi:Domain of unknown function (DUF4337)